MAERRHRDVTQLRGIDPTHVNPDRVLIESAQTAEWLRTYERTETVEVERVPGWALKLPSVRQVKIFTMAALASITLLSATSNAGVERRTPIKTGHDIETPFNNRDFMAQVQKQVGNKISIDVINRFITKDQDGKEVFNFGAIFLPLSINVTSKEKFNLDVQLNIPYDWARTFSEVQKTDPARAQGMKADLVKQLQKQATEQFIIHGIPGLTNSTGVLNAHGEGFALSADGNLVPRIAEGLVVKDVKVIGGASDEATKAESLGARDTKNVALAESRAKDFEPVIRDALQLAGFDVSRLKSFDVGGVENQLTEGEIVKPSDIAGRQARWSRDGGMDTDFAMKTIYAYNHGEALDLTPEDQAFLHQVLNGQRRVSVAVHATGAQKKTETFNVGVFLPLILLLGSVKRSGGGSKTVKRNYLEDVHTVVIERTPIARRIFSETTPRHADTDFHALYDSIDLNANGMYQDVQNLQRHMLIEEVLPSLEPAKKEPYIDYVDIANKALQYMYSDTSPDGMIRKGRYPTTAEAQRFIAEQLIAMWEHHDQATYPMKGIDIKTVLNYRHSKDVVLWAKVLAEKFTGINQALYSDKESRLKAEGKDTLKPIVTREEFTQELRSQIMTQKFSRNGRYNKEDMYQNRNVFVISQQPESGEYKARVGSY